MSADHYIFEVRNYLREALDLADSECEVEPPPGNPPPSAGVRYVAPTIGNCKNDAGQSDYIIMVVDVNVVLSVRATDIPADKFQAFLADKVRSIVHLAHRVGVAVHQNRYEIQDRVNSKMPQNQEGFTVPLSVVNFGRPQAEPASWWGLEENKIFGGYSQVVQFTGAVRTISVPDFEEETQ